MRARSEPYYLGLGGYPPGLQDGPTEDCRGNGKCFIHDCYVEDVAKEYAEMAER